MALSPSFEMKSYTTPIVPLAKPKVVFMFQSIIIFAPKAIKVVTGKFLAHISECKEEPSPSCFALILRIGELSDCNDFILFSVHS